VDIRTANVPALGCAVCVLESFRLCHCVFWR